MNEYLLNKRHLLFPPLLVLLIEVTRSCCTVLRPRNQLSECTKMSVYGDICRIDHYNPDAAGDITVMLFCVHLLCFQPKDRVCNHITSFTFICLGLRIHVDNINIFKTLSCQSYFISYTLSINPLCLNKITCSCYVE